MSKPRAASIRQGWDSAPAAGLLRLGTALALLALPSSAIRSQEPDSVLADSIPLYRLGGLTVTVSRTNEELDELPFAASLLTAPQIQRLEATLALDEALVQVPGVLVENRYNNALGTRISIRGFGARSQFGVRGIRILQDGIPLTLPDGQAQLNNLDLAAAGRIEVIRGPASALYGNASGGVISVKTEPPPPGSFTPEAWVLGGGFGDGRTYQKYDLKFGGQPGDLDYTAHLSHFQTEGFRVHSEAEYTLLNARARYRPDRRSQLTVLLNYVNTPKAENPSSLTDSLARANPDTVRPIVLPRSECPADPGFGGCQNLGEESQQGQVGVLYRRGLGDRHEISVMAYGLYRDLENRIPFRLIQLDRRAAGARLEYRFLPTRGRLTDLMVGLDLDRQADDRLERERDDQGVGPVSLDQDEQVTGLGVFAHAGLRALPSVELNATLRYDRARFTAEDRLVGAGDPDDSGRRTMDQWSPMIGLRYRPLPWLDLYGNVGRSFLTPTTTELTDTLGGFNSALEPERATNIEVGLKARAARRLAYSLALFHTRVEDQLIGFEATDIQRVFFRNAGSSVHRGAELGLAALLATGLTANLAYTYSDFEFDEFRTEDGDFGGNDLPGIPPHRLHVRLNYGRATGPAASIQLTAVDGFYVDNANQARNGGYARADLRFGYILRTPRLELRPFLGINNIFAARYNSSVVVNAIADRYYEPAPGRNLYGGLRITAR